MSATTEAVRPEISCEWYKQMICGETWHRLRTAGYSIDQVDHLLKLDEGTGLTLRAVRWAQQLHALGWGDSDLASLQETVKDYDLPRLWQAIWAFASDDPDVSLRPPTLPLDFPDPETAKRFLKIACAAMTVGLPQSDFLADVI